MNLSQLLVAALQFLAALAGADRVPLGVLLGAVALIATTGAITVWIFMRPVVTVFKNLAPFGAKMIDAVARYSNTRGRNRSRDALCTAIADKGSPQDMLQALQEISRVSPMDAPGASIYQGPRPDPTVPASRPPAPETTVVIPPAAWPRAETSKS